MTPTETCLQLDVGNSSAKWRLCQGGEVTARGKYQSSDSSTQDSLLNCTDRLDHIWISSVATGICSGSVFFFLSRLINRLSGSMR